jgi:hypothetical protein
MIFLQLVMEDPVGGWNVERKASQKLMILLTLALVLVAFARAARQTTPFAASKPASVRLYVFDFGSYPIANIERFGLRLKAATASSSI